MMGNARFDYKKVYCDLHRIPELGYQEYKTQNYLLEFLRHLPKERISVQTERTGIFVFVKGRDPRKTIAYRADMDGLSIKEETGLPYASVHEGRMHACGHDLHMTVALGVLVEILREPIDENVLFIFQPAEEGPGGAEFMMKSAFFQTYRPDEIFALHIAPEYPVGTIASRSGLLFSNTSELFIDLKGRGAHAANPHLAKDMVVAACLLVNQLQTILSRNIEPLDSAVLTIGKITSGTAQNIISDYARIEGTIRTFKPETMEFIKGRIKDICRGIEISQSCQIGIDFGANYYQVFNDGRKLESFRRSLDDSGVVYRECPPTMAGEDFGYFLREIPGFMFWLGVDSPYGLHSSRLVPKMEAIPVGIRAVTTYLRKQGLR